MQSNIRNGSIANNGNRQGEEHDDASSAQSIGKESHNYSDDSGNGIWRNSKELCPVGFVPETLDDCWQEKAEAVKAREDGEVGGSGEPELKIDNASNDLRPPEFFHARLAARQT